MNVLALDPSVRSPGVAVFERGRLTYADRVKVPLSGWSSDGERWQMVADAIVSMCRGLPQANIIVYEKPQIYTAVKSKGDPNDLIPLAAIGAIFACRMLQVDPPCIGGPARILTPTPAEWIGQCPKATKGSAFESPRAKRILSRLDAEEMALVPDQHDAIDAIGLGLFCLGRLKPKRVFTSE